MTKGERISGDERRKLVLQWLQEEGAPLTGSLLAKKTNVSRQVICQDISLLKAKNEPILATAQGYLYIKNQSRQKPHRVIACFHSPEHTQDELNLIVDCGVTVRDVKVNHPLYGDLTASIMVTNRNEVRQFLEKIEVTKATLLSQLTEGVHLHTLEAENEEQLERAIEQLEKAGFLATN